MPGTPSFRMSTTRCGGEVRTCMYSCIPLTGIREGYRKKGSKVVVSFYLRSSWTLLCGPSERVFERSLRCSTARSAHTVVPAHPPSLSLVLFLLRTTRLLLLLATCWSYGGIVNMRPVSKSDWVPASLVKLEGLPT